MPTIMPDGDYYKWYCDWCDTRNMTIWVKVGNGNLTCTACQRKHTVNEQGVPIISYEETDMILAA
jgi:hypothetical protein